MDRDTLVKVTLTLEQAHAFLEMAAFALPKMEYPFEGPHESAVRRLMHAVAWAEQRLKAR